jgi:hypothetical protein
LALLSASLGSITELPTCEYTVDVILGARDCRSVSKRKSCLAMLAIARHESPGWVNHVSHFRATGRRVFEHSVLRVAHSIPHTP